MDAGLGVNRSQPLFLQTIFIKKFKKVINIGAVTVKTCFCFVLSLVNVFKVQRVTFKFFKKL